MGKDDWLLKKLLWCMLLLMLVSAGPPQCVGHSCEEQARPVPDASYWGTWGDPFFSTTLDTRFVLGDTDSSPYNGYYWVLDRSSWVPGMVTNKTWFLPSPQYTIGSAVYYAAGVMEATASWRDMSLKGFVGGVSLLSPADIGQVVWLRRPGEWEWEGPFLVVDCARRSDIWPIIYYRGEVVEVDFKTAIRWGMVKGGGDYNRVSMRMDAVEVWKGEFSPDTFSRKQPVDLRSWWIPLATFTKRWEDPPIWEPGATWRDYKGNPVTATGVEELPAPIVPELILWTAVNDCKPEWRSCGDALRTLQRWGVY